MDIRIQSIKFDADVKLLEFIEKKFEKLTKFLDNIIATEVALTLEPEHKKTVRARLEIPGDDIIVERTADTFEDAVVDCVDVLKDQIVKIKETRFNR